MKGLTAVLAAAVLALGGCAGTGSGGNGRAGDADPAASGGAGSGSGPGGPGGTNGGPGNTATGSGGLVELRVLADTSLTEAFGTVEQRFEEQNPGIEVITTYAESGVLARRIAEGEPADVYATDDLFTLRTVTDAGRAAEKRAEFGRGRLVVTVLRQAADPAAAASFVDFLNRDDGKRVLVDAGLLRP